MLPARSGCLNRLLLIMLVFGCVKRYNVTEVVSVTNRTNLLTAHQLAAQLNLSVETIWMYTRDDRIPYLSLGNKEYRYDLDSVVSVLTGGKEKSAEYQGKITFKDFLKMPDEPGYCIEILDGVVLKEPAPGPRHQFVSYRLQRLLADYFAIVDPSGILFGAPLGVTLSKFDIFQPDLLYVSGRQLEMLEENRVNGSPELVVEIHSPSSYRRDRVFKMEAYSKAGIPHYWMVDAYEYTLEAYTLINGCYTRVAAGCDNSLLIHPNFPGLEIDLSSIWYKR